MASGHDSSPVVDMLDEEQQVPQMNEEQQMLDEEQQDANYDPFDLPVREPNKKDEVYDPNLPTSIGDREYDPTNPTVSTDEEKLNKQANVGEMNTAASHSQLVDAKELRY